MLKEKLLAELEQNRDTVLSGQQLADLFSVSRNAVWKAIKALKDEGHEIESVPQKGYRLKPSSDVLSKEGIIQYLNNINEEEIPEIHIYQQIDSTNSEAKRLITQSSAKNIIVIAKEQFNGRGRGGHSFYSPADTGLYMSVALKPKLRIKQALLITTAAAVAVMNAIYNLTGKKTQIKWVNDLFYNNKKVCGILTEAITDFESGDVSDIIIGAGININTCEFPEELKEIACSLEEDNITKNEFAAEIYRQITYVCAHLNDAEILKQARENSFVIGKKIEIDDTNTHRYATAYDIDSDGSLICTDDENNKFNLRTGSIRLV